MTDTLRDQVAAALAAKANQWRGKLGFPTRIGDGETVQYAAAARDLLAAIDAAVPALSVPGGLDEALASEVARAIVAMFNAAGQGQRAHSQALDDALASVRRAAALSVPGGLDEAYRERNAVVAALIRVGGYRTWRMLAPDAEGWWIVYAETPVGQVSWHVSATDIRLFDDVPVGTDPWDGHSTEEKYERVAALAQRAPERSELAVALLRLYDAAEARPDIRAAIQPFLAEQGEQG